MQKRVDRFLRVTNRPAPTNLETSRFPCRRWPRLRGRPLFCVGGRWSVGQSVSELDLERQQRFGPAPGSGPLRHGVLDREEQQLAGGVL